MHSGSGTVNYIVRYMHGYIVKAFSFTLSKTPSSWHHLTSLTSVECCKAGPFPVCSGSRWHWHFGYFKMSFNPLRTAKKISNFRQNFTSSVPIYMEFISVGIFAKSFSFQKYGILFSFRFF